MVTEFGKQLRKLRIDCEESLRDMAYKLGVTASFISSVELGKRTIPKDWVRKITDLYSLSSQEERQLAKLAADSAISLKILLKDASAEQREAAYAFAHRFCNISPETAVEIIELLNKEPVQA